MLVNKIVICLGRFCTHEHGIKMVTLLGYGGCVNIMEQKNIVDMDIFSFFTMLCPCRKM